MTRRSLLASLMALSLLCGGLGVASASLEVVDQSGTAGTVTIYTKDEVDNALTAKGSATDVASNTTDITNLKNAVGDAGSGLTKEVADQKAAITANTTSIDTNKAAIESLRDDKLDKALANSTFATKDALNDLTTTVNGKADEAAVATALDGKANKADTLAGYGITDAYTKGDIDDKLNAKADAANVFTKDQTYTRDQVNTKLADYAKSADVYTKTDADAKFATSGALTTAKTELDQKIDNEIANRITSDTALDQKIDKEIQDRENAIKDTNDRTGGIARNTEKTQTTIEGIVKVDNQGNVKDVKGLAAETITTSGNADLKGNVILGTNTANTVTVNGNADFNEAVNMDKGLTVTSGDTTLKGTKVDGKLTVTDETDLKNTKVDGTLTTTGKATFQEAVEMDKGLTVTSGDTTLKGTKVDGKLTVTDEADLKNTKVEGTLGVTGETKLDDKLTVKGEAKFEKNVTVDKDLTVTGKLNVGEISMKNDKLDTHGNKHDSTTTITADGISNDAKVTDKNGVTTESKFTHDKEGSTTYAKKGNATDWKGATSNVTADGVSNKMEDSAGNTHTYYQTATETKEQLVNGNKSNFEKKTAEGNTISIKDKDADGNKKSLTNKQTVDGEKTSVTNKDSSSTINQGADQIRNYVASTDGTKSSTEVKADGITNTSDGTIINDAKDIVNNATGDMTNTVGGKLTTTVTGAAEETYKSGLKTDITGDETHTVTGKQTNTVKGGQVNNISGGQKNNILTGNQETTVTDGSIINKAENGDISNTAKNVTNEGTESVTNKVGNNEVKVSQDGVDIKAEAGKKITESVGTTSRVVENDKITDEAGDSTVTTEKGKGTTFGKAGSTDTTNIYGDSIKTGTINAKDTTTDKLTAGAAAGADGGRLTVDAKDGVKGSYKSGDYTSRSYILANTLKSGVDNGKDPTDADFVGSRTDHYMDGDKAKLDETVKDADGSNVTNKTSTGTVTTITDGTTTSIIDQKKDSITSAVGDGTTSTVIKQDKDNVTIASSAGTVGIAGKDIINKATDTITNTAGTKITDTAGDSTVTTENGKGTTFTKTGSTAYREGGPTDTNISGNTITTGKVTMDYAEVMKDLGVHGNANITGKTTTGSLEVTGTSTLKGDVTMGSNATVNGNFTVNGTTNLKDTNVGGKLDVTGKATFSDDVDIKKNLSVVGDVTANSYKVGDKTYIDKNGIHANGQKITDVADGSISEGSKDAVNGGQLYGVKNDLEGKVNKVGANAAAMANLHPMEFDPDSKWNIAAAIGNYGSETAAALGAFYRPNDDVMVNLSTAFGTGENMVGGGVSVRLGQGGNKLSREDSNQLKAQVADLTARMDALLSVLNPNMSKDFPDVPENHWAYEAVSRLAGNDIVQGYPDGEFHGERTMTRYEMAEIIYNALSRGAEAEKELVEEFKPELQAMAASEKATAERAEG